VRLFLIGVVLGVATAVAATDVLLAERHRTWLDEEVSAIVTEDERRAFLELDRSDARDAFIEAFWQARDPTPGTARNEVRRAHAERIAEADRLFRRGKRVRGSLTARGRVWVQLGPPLDRGRFGPNGRVHPIELWLYQTDRSIDLPGAFWVMFYRPGGAGPWSLYDPFDGPGELVGGFSARHVASRDDDLRVLGALFPTLSHAAMTLLPGELPRRGESGGVAGGTPWAAVRTFGKIQSIPERLPVAEDWLERHLRGETTIETEFTLRDLGLAATFEGIHDDDGRTALRYAIEIPAASLGLLSYRGKLSGAIEIIGRIVEDGERSSIDIGETIELELSDAELSRVGRRPLVFHDDPPLLPGIYAVDLVVRNLVTREFGVVTGRFEVPATPQLEPTAAEETGGTWQIRPRRGRTPGDDAVAYGDQHRARRDDAAAIAVWERDLDGGGAEHQRRSRLGDLFVAEHEYRRAAAILAPLLRDATAPAHALVLLGMARSALGHGAAAQAAYEAALLRTPDHRDALNLLAEEYAKAGRAPAARALLDRSLTIEPDQPAVRRLSAELAAP